MGDHWSPIGNARHTVGAHSICARKGAAACGASGTLPPTAARTVHAAQKTPSARGKNAPFFAGRSKLHKFFSKISKTLLFKDLKK
jgi:hypothetical protein